MSRILWGFWVSVTVVFVVAVLALQLRAGDDDVQPGGPATSGRSAAESEEAEPERKCKRDRRTARLATLSGLVNACEVSLAEAVRTAERAAKGRAFEVEMERENGRVQFCVEVLTGGDRPRVLGVEVDAVTGAVVEIECDDGEGGDDADEDDEDDGDEDDEEVDESEGDEQGGGS